MATITLKFANTGEEIPVNDLDLSTVTNNELINQLVAAGMAPEIPGKVYKLVGRNNQPVDEIASLSSLGFNDGDTITLVAKPEGAATITLKFANTGEEIPVNDLDLSTVTNNELINQLVAAGLAQEYKKWALVGRNDKPIYENALLLTLGFNDGDTILIVSVG